MDFTKREEQMLSLWLGFMVVNGFLILVGNFLINQIMIVGSIIFVVSYFLIQEVRNKNKRELQDA